MYVHINKTTRKTGTMRMPASTERNAVLVWAVTGCIVAAMKSILATH